VKWRVAGRRLPGTVTPLRGWGDLAFRLGVIVYFVGFVIALGYVAYLLAPSPPARIAVAVFLAGFVVGRATSRAW
jgi:hypothetical protein